MKIYQLTQASLAEAQDFDADDIVEDMLSGNPLFSSVDKAKAFAQKVVDSLGEDSDGNTWALTWEQSDDGTWHGTDANPNADDCFGADDCATIFRIIECSMDPQLEG